MEEDLKKLDDLFDSILDEIIHPENAGLHKNPFIEQKNNRIAELSEAVTVIMVNISDDSMSAYATVMARGSNHKPFKADDILRVASSNGVFYGIDENVVRDMAEKQTINTEVLIATGTKPVDGTDGRLSMKYDISDGEEISGIQAGDEICHAINPHAGRDGKDVRGRVLPAAQGNPVDIKIGEGIVKRGNRYYSEYSGTLVCRGGVYSIVDEMVLNKNIDQSSGIIGYGGTIVINGNVTGKAVIKAGRSVIVHGIVSSAVIEAERDIRVEGRVNDASLSAAGGSIYGTEFVESTLVAGEGITASELDFCTVKCVTGIECMSGYGRIVGGEVYCAGNVNCITVGNREHTETHMILGDCTEFNMEISQLESHAARLDSEIIRITDQVNEIREREKQGTATLDDKSFLDAALRIRTQKSGEKAPISERIKRLNEIIALSSKATLKTKSMIYGGAFLKIGGFSQVLNSDRAHATAYSNGRAVVVT
ncbi:MAG: DUF342 domain-containing protein [Ruminiclostridium sp.]|nr:DUF342 domain-containing protein [Ruminiclostridium sp.]